MFSAGHVRAPRKEIKNAYIKRFPGSVNKLVRYLAEMLYDELSGPMPFYWSRR